MLAVLAHHDSEADALQAKHMEMCQTYKTARAPAAH